MYLTDVMYVRTTVKLPLTSPVPNFGRLRRGVKIVNARHSMMPDNGFSSLKVNRKRNEIRVIFRSSCGSSWLRVWVQGSWFPTQTTVVYFTKSQC